jgi:hypothetical protein
MDFKFPDDVAETERRIYRNQIQRSAWPSFTTEEGSAIERLLLSNRVNYWTGTECRDLEREFA